MTIAKVLTFVTILYVVFGAVCYICFGSGTQDIIFQSMPAGDTVTKLVKVFVSLSLLSQFPVTAFPAFFIIEPYLFADGKNQVLRRVVRTLLCVASAAVAIVLPFFVKVMALVGAFSSGVIVFVLPSLLHLTLFKKELSTSQKMLDSLIIAFGILSSITASTLIAISLAGSAQVAP